MQEERKGINYTIPSDNRELQLPVIAEVTAVNYTIPSDNRELQLMRAGLTLLINYTIPSDNRELQHGLCSVCNGCIIPYQVITGNYNRR